MKSNHFKLLLVSILVVVFGGCALAPFQPGASRPSVSLQLPPSKAFGTMQEQGSVDAVPDVAAMVEYQQQRKQQRAAEATKRLAAPQWTDLGPSFNLGRVIDIAFHPQNSNIIYIASPGGGAYKTIDGGGTWSWLGGLPYQAVNSIAIDPLNPEVVYFGTGHYNASGSDLLSMGVYKTADGGLSFSLLTATVPTTSNTDWLRITRIATHPTIGNLVFAGTFAGFFRSTNGGASWSKVSTLATYDIAIDPNDPAKMLRGRYDGDISYSTDAGASWTAATVVVPIVRTRVKYARSSPGVVYAAVDQNSGELHKSVDGG